MPARSSGGSAADGPPPTGPGPSPPTTRSAAHAYDDAVVALSVIRIALATLLTGPPSPVGALWTWPVHLRLLRGFPDTVATLEATLLRVEMVGSPPVVAAVEDAVEIIVAAVASFPASRRKSQRANRGKCHRQLGLLAEATVGVTIAARGDLGHGPGRLPAPATDQDD